MRNRPLLPLMLLLAALGCSDYTGLPTDTDDGSGTPTGAPRLVTGDSLRILSQMPRSFPAKCTDLAREDTFYIGDPLYVCVPAEAYRPGLLGFSIAGKQVQVDPRLGTNHSVDVFALLNGTFDDTTRTRTLFIPRIDPLSAQQGGPFTLSVQLLAVAGVASRFEIPGNLIGRTAVTVSEPAESTRVAIGSSLTVKTQVTNPAGISKVLLSWSGGTSGMESVLLPLLPKDTTVSHTIVIPSSASPGKMTILVSGFDGSGKEGAPSSRTVFLARMQPDLPAPSSAFKSTPATLGTGDSLTVNASDASRVGLVGFVIADKTTRRILYADSAAVTPDTSASRTFGVRLPTDFSYGDALLIAFAKDTAGNRGWMRTGAAGVDSIQYASAQAVKVVAGEIVTVDLPRSLIASAVHRGRKEVYFTNSSRNQLEVLNVLTGKLGAPIYVGSMPTSAAFVPNADGTESDTLIVANSGGTDLSKVSVASHAEEARIFFPRLQVTNWPAAPGEPATPLSDRPYQVAATCANDNCTTHRVYMTSLPNGNLSLTATRTFMLEECTTFSIERACLPSAVDIVSPMVQTVGLNLADDSTSYALTVLQTPWNRVDTVAFRTGRSKYGTFYGTTPPVIAVRPLYPDTVLFVGESGSAAPAKTGALMMRLVPQMEWEGRAVAAEDYTRNVNEEVKFVQTNDDGSMMLAVTSSYVVITNTWLMRLATLDQSGFAASAAFLTGHSAATYKMADGGLIAVAQKDQPNIDVYDTWNFRIVARFPVSEKVEGALSFLRTGQGDGVAIVGQTASGLVIVRTSISDLVRRSALPVQ